MPGSNQTGRDRAIPAGICRRRRRTFERYRRNTMILARSSALGDRPPRRHTAGMACDTCGGGSFHRASCPLLLSKVYLVTAVLSVAFAVGLARGQLVRMNRGSPAPGIDASLLVS